MKVTLRNKPINDGKTSLYLDYYPPIKNPKNGKLTRREFLGLYLFANPISQIERKHNKETLQLAENIKAQRQLALQADDYGFLKKNNKDSDFLAYFSKLANKHKELNKGDKNNWISVYRHLSIFTNSICLFKDVDEQFCKEFKKYLLEAHPLIENRQKLANNSAVAYFNIFKRVVKQAYKERLFNEDFAKDVPAIRKLETKREFVSLEELRKLVKAHCDLPIAKNAALFSALTGLRYSDIEKLVWSEIVGSKDNYAIRFTQKKTNGVETLPISQDAFKFCGTPQKGNERVFEGLKYSAWQNQKLQEWVYNAGIMRKMTFHSFRHSFATMQLQEGTDIYTVSKLLGHRSVTTTQIYAKVIDEAKRKAVDRIKL